MLTPLDIYGKTFSKSLRGYDPQEVDTFLAKIVKTFEDIYKENLELKEKAELSKTTIERYQQLEKTMQNTLLIAQTTAEEVKENASRDREILMKETAGKAQQLLAEAELEIQSKKRELEVNALVADNKSQEIKEAALREKELLLKDIEEIKVSAIRDKESILKEAENKAQQMLEEAEAQIQVKKKELEEFVANAQVEFEEIKKNGKVARAKLRGLLETELRLMYEEQFEEEIREEREEKKAIKAKGAIEVEVVEEKEVIVKEPVKEEVFEAKEVTTKETAIKKETENAIAKDEIIKPEVAKEQEVVKKTNIVGEIKAV